MTMEEQDTALQALHYLYPATVFAYFAVTSIIAICKLQTSIEIEKQPHDRLKLIKGLIAGFVACYVAQLVVLLVEWSIHGTPPPDYVVGLLSCVLVFGVHLNALPSGTNDVWYPSYGSWFIGLGAEPAIVVLDSLRQARIYGFNLFTWIGMGLATARYIILIAATLIYFTRRDGTEMDLTDDENSPLLKPDRRPSNGSDSGYGTNSELAIEAENTTNTEAASNPTEAESPWERQEREAREQMEKRLKSEGSWIAYAKGFLVFFPYIWPVKNRRLQFQAAMVGVCLLIKNALNLFIPRQLGIIMDTLSGKTGADPWVQVIIFAVLKLASSEAGINLVRQMLWMDVENYGQKALTTAAYSHVMNLSSEFHDSKSTSDLLVAISSGQAITNMLESVCFEALPSLIDLAVAFVYLSSMFGPYEGFITIVTGVAFIQAASFIISHVREKRKKMVKAFFEEHYIRQAGIQGWHTVSAFNQVAYEENRHSVAVSSVVMSLKSMYQGYMVGQAFQYLILLSGLLAGSFLAVYQVTYKGKTAGDFVVLLTYWAQLTMPLNFFASLGRKISQDLVSAERLLDVMTTKATVSESPDAKPLLLQGGNVELRNVSFSYDKKKDILKGVDLSVTQGQTVAFVGSTGAGKSTILKLLGRFYDVKDGSILIDGQDIRHVQISSLRQAIGLVPQAPILFDDTIINNIRYARLTASDEEVHEACKAAAIHDHITGFTEGYQTRVGERGVKLSGGELQRIAIARAILKQPEIVLLDEATSAVDTDTEQKIQDGLQALCQGRTTFIVAHRLSTVMNADVIFVVQGGEVVEKGSHEELLEKKGKYSELWSKQIFAKPRETKGTGGNQKSSLDSSVTGELDSERDDSKVGNETKSQSVRAVDEPRMTQSEAITNNTTRRQGSGSDTTEGNDKGSDEQVARTPRGHGTEKLNPSAREFTPQSAAAKERLPTSGIDASPCRKDWADDVEADQTSRMENCGTASNSGDIDASTRAIWPADFSLDDLTEPAAESPGGDDSVGYRRREPQDTMRSVSDPIQLSRPPTPTPTRSESAVPKPFPKAPLAERVNDALRVTTAQTHDPSSRGSKNSSGLSRSRGGRGSRRGSGHRGRGGQVSHDRQNPSSSITEANPGSA